MNPMDGLDEPLFDDDDTKRRRWTKREDEKLRAGVRALGTDDWARVCSRYLSATAARRTSAGTAGSTCCARVW